MPRLGGKKAEAKYRHKVSSLLGNQAILRRFSVIPLAGEKPIEKKLVKLCRQEWEKGC